jgi:hypothetical protein
MKFFLFGFIFVAATLFAKTDFSEMSTEELVAMMGYVSQENKSSLQKELEFRYPKMNEKEKTIYIKNLAKLKK